MRRTIVVLSALAILTALSVPIDSASAKTVSQYKQKSYRDGGVTLRMSVPKGSVLNPGDEISFTYQASQDGYAVLFNIDAEGYVHLIHPVEGDFARADARETYRVPASRGDQLLVSGQTGMEFIFALTVADRAALDADELAYLRDMESRPLEERYRIDGDPFIAANIIAGELVRGVSHRDGVFLDFTYFFVNERVDHPCYLCGECDGSGDPLCDDFELVANLDRTTPLTYPLRRAYQMIYRNAPVDDGDDIDVAYIEEDDGDDDRVDINFYPYSSRVRYVTRPQAYGYDWDWYDPLWYDPWSSGYVYSSWTYPYYGHYNSWSFGWGWYDGCYYSSWYYPRYYSSYDYYHHNYYDYASYRHVNYKTAYKQRSSTIYRDNTSLVSLRDRSVKRNDKLRIASGDLRHSRTGSSVKAVRGRSSRTSVKGTSTRTSTRKGVRTTTRVTNRRGKASIKSNRGDTRRTTKGVKRSTQPRVRSKSNRTRDGKSYKPRSNTRSGKSSRSAVKRGRRSSSSKSKSYKRPSGSSRTRSQSVKSTRRSNSSSSKSRPAVRRSSSRSSKSPARSSSRSTSSRSGSSKSKSKRR